MGHEETPIDPEEYVLRRIHKSNYKRLLPIPVATAAFRPNDNDDDGISLYRECMTSPATLASSARKPASEYVIARIKVADVLGLGLSLKLSESIGDLPGHVVIPEVNWGGYNSNAREKEKMKEIGKNLAELASKDVLTDFTAQEQ